MVKKIIHIGNSLGITLSSVYIKQAKIKLGDFVDVPENEIIPVKGKRTKKKKLHLEGVTPQFVALLDEVIEEYKPALHALSRK